MFLKVCERCQSAGNSAKGCRSFNTIIKASKYIHNNERETVLRDYFGCVYFTGRCNAILPLLPIRCGQIISLCAARLFVKIYSTQTLYETVNCGQRGFVDYNSKRSMETSKSTAAAQSLVLCVHVLQREAKPVSQSRQSPWVCCCTHTACSSAVTYLIKHILKLALKLLLAAAAVHKAFH